MSCAKKKEKILKAILITTLPGSKNSAALCVKIKSPHFPPRYFSLETKNHEKLWFVGSGVSLVECAILCEHSGLEDAALLNYYY